MSDELAEAARREFRKRGWFDQMRAQVKRVGGKIAGLGYREATKIFNVRFKEKDANRYEPMRPVRIDDTIRRLKRYTLVKLAGDLAHVERQWSRRVSRTPRPRFASAHLTVGTVYTRKQLAEQFGITDATLNTGVFQPKGSSSIWLFVTEKKSPDRTQYEDRLEDDTLHWL